MIVHTNEEGLRAGISPFTHGSGVYTEIMKTEALKQALDKYRFDAALGGARRDEEKSRAKERVFSFRTARTAGIHGISGRNYGGSTTARSTKAKAFALFRCRIGPNSISGSTSRAKTSRSFRSTLPSGGRLLNATAALIMVDDERLKLSPGELVENRMVRFRTLGCYPLSGGVESTAETVADVIRETLVATTSESRSRIIDHDQDASMERKKRMGYF